MVIIVLNDQSPAIPDLIQDQELSLGTDIVGDDIGDDIDIDHLGLGLKHD